MSALDDHLKKHRRKIIEREEQTFRDLLAAYAEIEKDLKKSFDELQAKIEAARKAGDEIGLAWFFKEKRLKNLLADVQAQITRFGGEASSIIEREQRAAIKIAVAQAQDTFDFQIKAADRADLARNFGGSLNTRAVETAAGLMGDGSPLAEYFEKNLAPLVAERIKTEVIKAAAVGTNFSTIAKRLQETGDITKHRAFSVARTETNRVRRSATLSIFRENSDIISGWEWCSAKSSRACALCLAMDGREFPLDEPFPQHVSCRCSMISIIIGLKRRPRTIGKDWFEEQPNAVKEEILGTDAFAVYQDKNLTLDDFVAFRNDKRFGKSVTRKPLAKVLADKGIEIDSKAMGGKAKGDGYFFHENTLPYTPKGAVIAQIQPNACVAAASRMILEDAGISKSEAELRTLFDVDRDGATPAKIPEVMAKFGLKYDYRRDLTIENLQSAVRLKPAIAYVSTSLPNTPGHVIIIDGFEPDHVLVRDSEGGRSYKLHIADFKLAWLDDKGSGRAAIGND